MASSIIELYVDVPADRQANIFGQFDEHLKLIERTLNVTMIFRDGSLKILGSQEGATQARAIVEELNTLAGRGNTITQQNVNYALSLAMEKIGSVMEEIDKDFICNTIQGRPIKPKTLGQKDYVEQIRKKMIVFGVGPAGTGKTYLAMAMAVTAFRNEEVSRIILTRPAIEAGEKLGFLPESQNDMIFAIICEELGLFGAIAVIMLFLLMIYRFVMIANDAPDLFGALLVVGVMAHIAIQVILNIAVVTNTIPNTGITLPFISYGGTSVLFLMVEMGIVLSVSNQIRAAV